MRFARIGFFRMGRLFATACFCFLALLVAAFFLTSRASPLAALPKAAPRALAIDVVAQPLAPLGGRSASDQQSYGKLEWIGGLKLSSDEPAFGGFSGLAFLDREHFVAISDRGSVLSAKLALKDGRPVAITDASMRMLPGIGAELPQWRRDSEGLALKDGQAFVSFEGDTRVTRYSMQGNALLRLEGRLPLNAEIEAANQANRGLEAIATIPDSSPYAGGFVLLSEKPQDGKIVGWIVGSGAPKRFSLPQSGELLASDAAFTQQGDLIILERNFSLLGGLEVQLRQIDAKDFRAGDMTRSDLLFRANLGDGIDNMEALDIQPMGEGDSLVTLMSDDNFNFIQDTILLQFRLPAQP
ncbi:esterase-like activity of phytase family protein [uncultured Cohaesibacter sp.]|uniref:esterase-like activity of phytase family protein n=1 Tax=uncultured Cohaesibacter sp. TaxID=1002546 RepID=UPI002AAB57FF|nr:esterase-like activity of phytase family protein [uncultured Cohaesibacter sp.]